MSFVQVGQVITPQEAFDINWKWFVEEQHGPSMENTARGGIDCLYRGEGGTMCAAGLLIPDEKFLERFNSGTNAVSYAKAADLAVEWSLLIGSFLYDIQKAHDSAVFEYNPKIGNNKMYDNFSERIKSNLEGFAKRYKLVIPEGEVN